MKGRFIQMFVPRKSRHDKSSVQPGIAGISRIAGILSILAAACVSSASLAHEFYGEKFQLVHPWTDPAPAGAKEVVLSLKFVDVAADDRIIGASTPIARSVEVRGASPGPDASSAPGTSKPALELRAGQDADFHAKGAHLVLHDVNTELHFGRQYPLELVFEKAGRFDAEFIVGDH